MPVRLDHVAILVDNLDDGIKFYGEILGLGRPIRKHVPELSIRCAFFDAGRDHPPIELVEFSGDGELRHGDTVLAIEVQDLDEALESLRARGVRVFDQPATQNLPLRRGWILKDDAYGTVIEICQKGEVANFIRSHGETD